uniref:Putative WD repeat-containing protein C2A9.03-like n=1 Tax=Rhizophora mucronata TaxID=61149 RepID=A0A2P2LD41_RHIMU
MHAVGYRSTLETRPRICTYFGSRAAGWLRLRSITVSLQTNWF